MMEDNENHVENNQRNNDEVYSKSVRAGKRTYFFDVKSTKSNDFYLTITESKKKIKPDGSSFYEKHKIFLYKEDFEKFAEGLNDVVQYIRNNAISVPNSDISAGSDVHSENDAHSEETTENL
jgi:CRISPR/Cas system CSM-associated protein Csm2 small subunit